MAEPPPPVDDEATVFLPSDLRGAHWPTRDPDVSRRPYDEFATQIVARLPASTV